MTDRIAPDCGCVTTGKIVRGMCVPHYDRWIQVTPKDQRPPAPRTIRRYWDHVDKTGACWQWMGPINAKGYGVWSEPGFKGLAHRYSLMQVAEPFAGAFACHHCDNPSCVNPDHLYWGTVRDNSRDMRERRRGKNANTYKTHCIAGHPLSGGNLRVTGAEASRQCRTCDNERSRLRQAELRRGNRIADGVDEFIASTGKRLVTIAEATRISGLSDSTIRRAIKSGRLTLYRLSWKNCWVDAEELEVMS